MGEKNTRRKRSVWTGVIVTAVVVVVVTGWGAAHLLAQSNIAQSNRSTMTSMRGEVVAVDVATWREAAELAESYVEEFQVEGNPLVTSAMRYNVDRRIIHGVRGMDTPFPVQLPEDEWRNRLTPTQYDIIRRSGTERPFTSPLDKVYEKGIYYSRATGQPLFSSEDKFDSGTGWPSFTKPITPDAIAYFTDMSFFSRNIEVVDSLSGAHLGHVFNDGPAPTRQRYCINGVALIFVPEGGDPPELLLPAE